MNTLKKMAVLAVAVAAVALTTASTTQARWDWQHGTALKVRGDYGMNHVTHRPYRTIFR